MTPPTDYIRSASTVSSTPLRREHWNEPDQHSRRLSKMYISSVVLLCALSLVAAGPPPPLHPEPPKCRYWCKTPEGQFYCCEGNTKPVSRPEHKPGFCPPVRPVCPPVRFGPPITCSSDGSCPGSDKCCFDRCLEEHVCKAAEPHPPEPPHVHH